MTYEEHHRRLVAYLLAKVQEEDWHAVWDAAMDLRVLQVQDELGSWPHEESES